MTTAEPATGHRGRTSMQVRHRLADHVVDQDHASRRAEAVFHCPLKSLGRGEELSRERGGEIGEQPHVLLGHQQRVPVKQRPVVEERQQVVGFRDARRGQLAPDDLAEHAVRGRVTVIR